MRGSGYGYDNYLGTQELQVYQGCQSDDVYWGHQSQQTGRRDEYRPFSRNSIPKWPGEDPRTWLSFKKVLKRWKDARMFDDEAVACARLRLNFEPHGLCEKIYDRLDVGRLNTPTHKRWYPHKADGSFDWERAYGMPPRRVPGNHRERVFVDGVEQPDPDDDAWSNDSYDDVPIGAVEPKFSTGLNYLMEEFDKEFIKSDRNTFSRKFAKLFNMRRRGRHFAVWIEDFESALRDVADDPLCADRWHLPVFLHANWIVQTAELTDYQVQVLNTRMPEWKDITPDSLREQLRDILQPAEHGLPDPGRPRVMYAEEQVVPANHVFLNDPTVQTIQYYEPEECMDGNGVYGWYDHESETFLNTGAHEAVYYARFTMDDGSLGFFSSQDGEAWEPAEWLDEEEDEPPVYWQAPEGVNMTLQEAQAGIWMPDEYGAFECLAVYPSHFAPKARGRHEKEGDGASKPNKDGLTCHKCGGNNHFSNNCAQRGARPGKGGKAQRKGGKGSKKGKSTNWAGEAWPPPTYQAWPTPADDAYFFRRKGARKGKARGKGFTTRRRKGKGGGKGKRPKGKGGPRPFGAHYADPTPPLEVVYEQPEYPETYGWMTTIPSEQRPNEMPPLIANPSQLSSRGN